MPLPDTLLLVRVLTFCQILAWKSRVMHETVVFDRLPGFRPVFFRDMGQRSHKVVRTIFQSAVDARTRVAGFNVVEQRFTAISLNLTVVQLQQFNMAGTLENLIHGDAPGMVLRLIDVTGRNAVPMTIAGA